MAIAQIFYSVFWISAISVVWFYTDWFVHYTQLFGIFEQMRNKYLSYIAENPDKYFPDFLHTESMGTSNRLKKFAYKIVSCPFCLLVWFALGAAWYCSDIKIAAPIYILSLFITLQIRKLTYTH